MKSHLIWFLYNHISKAQYMEKDISNNIQENEIITKEVLQWNQSSWQR